MGKKSTKQKVIDAASELFFQHGFHGTSVRDIAERAAVNVSLISYYFKSKQGLLEYAVTQYYEEYLEVIDHVVDSNQEAIEILQKLIEAMIQYKTEHFQLTAFIHRELSLDSTFVREMSVTYLAKENHILTNLFSQILSSEKKRDKHYLFMQLKGMIMSPYIFRNEWNNQLFDQVDINNFVRNYGQTISKWLKYVNK
ncbi:MAG TPA: forespore capture DNA-binding protein RefZ [Pseudogracilibacillus sp.]|nr:forespore capture DNA-binding protein RefZ [Pseudogracilibacillus sp.]